MTDMMRCIHAVIIMAMWVTEYYAFLSSMHVFSWRFFYWLCFQIRNPRGRFRGRANGSGGRTRGVSRGNFRGNRSRTHPHDGNQNYSYVPKGSHVSDDNMKNARPDPHEYGKNGASKSSHAHNDDVDNLNVVPKESRTYNDNSRSHKDTPRVTRGRGSRRYQPRSRNTTEISSEQNNKCVEGFFLYRLSTLVLL